MLLLRSIPWRSLILGTRLPRNESGLAPHTSRGELHDGDYVLSRVSKADLVSFAVGNEIDASTESDGNGGTVDYEPD